MQDLREVVRRLLVALITLFVCCQALAGLIGSGKPLLGRPGLARKKVLGRKRLRAAILAHRERCLHPWRPFRSLLLPFMEAVTVNILAVSLGSVAGMLSCFATAQETAGSPAQVLAARAEQLSDSDEEDSLLPGEKTTGSPSSRGSSNEGSEGEWSSDEEGDDKEDEEEDWLEAGPSEPVARPPRIGLGLNLAALEGRAIGLSETQEKQARLTAFEPVCSEVAPGLFLGGMAVATDLGKMQESGITHVVNAIDHLQKNSFPELFEYLSLALNDAKDENIAKHFPEVNGFIKGALSGGGRVLVHCHQGVSRSAALVIAYLMSEERQEYGRVFQRVKKARDIVNPNLGFTFQLMKYGREELGLGQA